MNTRSISRKDAALERRFQTIVVEEPNVDDTIEILKGIKLNYEEHHNVKYTQTMLCRQLPKLADKYISDQLSSG